MTVTFADKLARMPHYEPGTSLDDARARAETADAIKLASNESPQGPHPAVVEAIAAAAAGVNRYPDPEARLLRARIADRTETEPGRIAVSNGSCEILLAGAEALCEPGAEIVYAWPSFSIYPHMTALAGAREIRVPLADGDLHDLDAMAGEVTAATQIVIVCNPNNPTGTHLPAAEIAAFLDLVPDHVTVILDEAYIEFQTVEDPDSTIDLMPDYPNLILLRTFSKAYGLAGLRVGYALCSAQFRAAVDAVRQPFSVNAIAQAAASEAILHQDDVIGRVERNVVERVFVEQGVRELGLETPGSEANFSWVELGENDEAEVIASLAAAGVAVRPGTPLGDPGHFRVTYGTRAENQRFLAALGAALSRD
ncbi:MAG: histidinol-phosphate transaminase [Actinomycetota bacterium]|nr:histidinol-phosphate transaminase [Actinomycetota bacterium]